MTLYLFISMKPSSPVSESCERFDPVGVLCSGYGGTAKADARAPEVTVADGWPEGLRDCESVLEELRERGSVEVLS